MIEMYEFIEATKDYHLTLGDIRKLKKDAILDVVSWDRNFEEPSIWSKRTPGKGYRPTRFFKDNRVTARYKGNMMWDLSSDAGTFTHEVHVCVADTDIKTNWTWVPIKNNQVTINEEMIPEGQKIPSHWRPTHMHIKEFPDEVRVGFRGPMMPWSVLEDIDDKVYWKDE